MSRAPVKRVYDNRLRAEQALATRSRVVAAARTEFLSRGYAAVSMGMIAAAAGVSREMLYKVFGSKAALLKAVYDVTLAGDADSAAMAERPELLAIYDDPDPRSMVARLAAISADLVGRLGPLFAMISVGAGAGDPDLTELAAVSGRERLIGCEMLVRAIAGTGGLRSDLTPDEAADILWTLLSPQVWQLLVDERGWTLDRYERWLDRSMADALLSGDRVPDRQGRLSESPPRTDSR